MEQLISSVALQKILERGLVTGKWSIAQFNAGARGEKVLPTAGFLKDHPQFLDMNFRDLPAFKRANHRGAF